MVATALALSGCTTDLDRLPDPVLVLTADRIGVEIDGSTCDFPVSRPMTFHIDGERIPAKSISRGGETSMSWCAFGACSPECRPIGFEIDDFDYPASVSLRQLGTNVVCRFKAEEGVWDTSTGPYAPGDTFWAALRDPPDTNPLSAEIYFSVDGEPGVFATSWRWTGQRIEAEVPDLASGHAQITWNLDFESPEFPPEKGDGWSCQDQFLGGWRQGLVEDEIR